MPAEAAQIARTELKVHQVAALFDGRSPGWEIGPIEVAGGPTVPDRAQAGIGVEVFDADPDFAFLMEQTKGRLAALNLSARRLNDIRIFSLFAQADTATAARAAFRARYLIPRGTTFMTETLRYTLEDVRISLLINFESRRPDPVLITRYQLMLRDAALAFGGSPPEWFHDDWRKR